MKLPFAGRLLAVALFAAASFSLPLAHADSPTPPKNRTGHEVIGQ